MDVTKQMKQEMEGYYPELMSDDETGTVFEGIMAGVTEENMPFQPVISLMNCGGWRADWFVQEPVISVRLIVSAAEGQHPIVFWEVGKEHGVEIADSALLNSYLKWLGTNMPTISDRPAQARRLLA